MAALAGAAKAVGALRDASGYRWVDLGALFGSVAARGKGAGAAGGAAARGVGGGTPLSAPTPLAVRR